MTENMDKPITDSPPSEQTQPTSNITLMLDCESIRVTPTAVKIIPKSMPLIESKSDIIY